MWVIGQRVIAEFEPELGLGVVTALHGPRQLEVAFPEVELTRRYSQQAAPLRRLVLNPTQKFRALDGKTHTISEVREINGLFQYESESGEKIWEMELDRVLGDGTPVSRLLTSTWENPKTFDLRKEAWELRSHSLEADIRGLVGPRVTLLPHQLGIAGEVARREYPRVLLSDEVGLGKTIEAGLIFSSLRSLGRADRVLIIVPEGLQHQWLAEMYRRFNEMFSLIDEDRSEQEDISQGQSAFAMNQRIICSLPFLLEGPERLEQAMDEEWDLLIVDESHRLKWDPSEPSIEWEIIRLLSQQARGLLLLTATPQSHGAETQFGLLHLVDPDRFHSFREFEDQSLQMKEIAEFAKRVQDEDRSSALKKEIKKWFKNDQDLLEGVDRYLKGGEPAELLQRLIDRHGTGRVLFRNRRARIKGFPKRSLVPHPFPAPEFYTKWLANLEAEEWETESVLKIASGNPELRSGEAKTDFFDARATAITQIIDSLGDEKVLLICSNPRRVRDLQNWLRNVSSIRTAIFDEDLDVVERDRQAAWFAEADGARVLLCSEIGGEGRNFQFCHHLILFDLPLHPDVLEQRIGRLDRIGQKHIIEIHIPYIEDSAESVLVKWYDQGLDIFSKPWGGAILEASSRLALADMARVYLPKAPGFKSRKKLMTAFLKKAAKDAETVRMIQESGVDLLVDINSFNQGKGITLAERIGRIDESSQTRQFMERAFEYFGVDCEKLDERGGIKVTMHSLTFVESFPGLSTTGELTATYDRKRALEQEEMAFLSSEHAVVQGALSLVLEGSVGKVSAGRGGLPPGVPILFEMLYVLETTAPAHLEVQRDLPTQVMNLTLSAHGEWITLNQAIHSGELQPISPRDQQELLKSIRATAALVLEKATAHAEKKAGPIIKQAKTDWEKRSWSELSRLRELAKINPLISPEELDAEEWKMKEGLMALSSVVPRLDAIRVLFA